MTDKNLENISFGNQQTIENQTDEVMTSLNAVTSPNDLPKVYNGEYCVQTPKRETYFVPTPSYYLRSSLKRKNITNTDVDNPACNNDIIQAQLSSTNLNDTPKRFKQNRRFTETTFKPDEKKNKASTKHSSKVSLSTFPSSTASRISHPNPTYDRRARRPASKMLNESSKKSHILHGRRTTTAQKSLDIIQNVMETCQNVRKSRTVVTPQKPHSMLTRADILQTGDRSVKNGPKQNLVRNKRKGSQITSNLVPAFESKERDSPGAKKSKLVTLTCPSREAKRSGKAVSSYRRSEIDIKKITHSRKTSERPVLQRRSIAGFNLDSATATQKETPKKFKSFKAQPVPLSMYSKPTIIKKSINLTVPRSPMFSSKFALKRKEPAQEIDSQAPPLKFYHPTPNFSAAFKPKLTSVKTKPQPFSFDSKDKERFQRRSERIKELSEPEVISAKFKAQPVPDSVLHVKSLPEKQVKKPTKIEPFQLRSKDRSTRAKKAHENTKKLENKSVATFKANRDYEKILKSKPWKPKIQRKPSTQPQQFTFQSEGRAQKRELLKRSKEFCLQKENRDAGALPNPSKKQEKLRRKPFSQKRAQNITVKNL